MRIKYALSLVDLNQSPPVPQKKGITHLPLLSFVDSDRKIGDAMGCRKKSGEKVWIKKMGKKFDVNI